MASSVHVSVHKLWENKRHSCLCLHAYRSCCAEARRGACVKLFRRLQYIRNKKMWFQHGGGVLTVLLSHWSPALTWMGSWLGGQSGHFDSKHGVAVSSQYRTLGWHRTSSMKTCYVFRLLCLHTRVHGHHRRPLAGILSICETCVDSKIPSEPPLTKWRVVNEWNFNFEQPFSLKEISYMEKYILKMS